MKYYWSPWIKQPKELFTSLDDQKFPFAIQVRKELYDEAKGEDEFGLPLTDEFGLPL